MELGMGNPFSEGLRGGRLPDFIDPWKYFGENAPRWAKAAWEGHPYYNEGSRIHVPGDIKLTDYGHEIAGVGGKGSAKTFTFSMRDLDLVQKFPGSKGMVVANSYAQAYGSAGEKIVEISNAIGLEFFHRTEMTIDGLKHYNVYVFPGFDSKICILSFDNINLIEGTEWDWAHFEEIQDCPLQGVETAISRVRRGKADSSVVFAGMPDDVNHWMYGYFEEHGIPLYEPPLKENEHNLPQKYMERMRRYHGSDFDRYVDGKRISLHRTPALRNLRWDVHVRSDDNPEMESLGYLSQYDPTQKIYLTWDYNVNPLCVSAWQDRQVGFDIKDTGTKTCPSCGQELVHSTILGGFGCPDHGMVLHPVEATSGRVTKKVLVQIDEWEMFGGSTKAMCELILKDYGTHHNGVFIIGDATGNKEYTTAPGKTDWSIVRHEFRNVRNVVIRPGAIQTRKPLTAKRKRGESKITYSNPSVKDRINILNAYLTDPDGHPRLIFMPESKYPSGGVAKSCSEAKWTPEGKIDSKNDKLPSENRTVARTHYFDGIGYYVWHRCDGKMPDVPQEDIIKSLDRAKFQKRMRYTSV